MRGLAVLVLLVVFMMASGVQASEYWDRNTRSMGGCLENGQVIFTFGEEGGQAYQTTELRLVAQKMIGFEPAGKNITLEGWWYYWNPSDVSTLFNWTPVDYNPSSIRSVNDIKTMFASREGYLNEPGQYRIQILNTSRRRNVVGTIEVACPGLKFACGLVNISIQRCWNTGDGTFRANFKAENIKAQSKLANARNLSLYKDFTYNLKGEKERIYSAFPTGAAVKELGGGEYSLEMKPGFEVLNFTLETQVCKPEYPFQYEDAWDKKACEPVPECSVGWECDDMDPCTRDECINRTCIYTDLCEKPETPAAPQQEPAEERPKDFLTILFESWAAALGSVFKILGMG